MTFRHFEVLREARNEFEAVPACAKHVRDHWLDAATEVDPLKLSDVESAAARLEASYIVRLTAAHEALAYEFLLKDATRPINEKSSGIELTNELAGMHSGNRSIPRASSTPSNGST